MYSKMTEGLRQNNDLRAVFMAEAPNRPILGFGRNCGSGTLSLLARSCIYHRNCIAGGRRCSRVSLDFNCGESEGLTC
jgi:hypothetical protein